MPVLELTNEELSILRDVLESDITTLQVQEIRTDSIDYRHMLKHKEEILEKILSMVEAKPAEPVT